MVLACRIDSGRALCIRILAGQAVFRHVVACYLHWPANLRLVAEDQPVGRGERNAFPYGDAFTTVASLTAQIMLARRFLANWTFWIAVDLVAIYIYWQKELIPTMILYALFLIMATVGLWQWRRIVAARNVSLMDKTPGEQTA